MTAERPIRRREVWPPRAKRRRSGRVAFLVATALLFAGCSTPADSTSAPAAKKVVAAPAPAVAWPMTRGGPALSGNVPVAVPRSPVIAWTFTASGPVTAEAAIANDRVYVGSGKGTLHCLEAATGKEVWQFATKDAITAAPAVTAAFV